MIAAITMTNTSEAIGIVRAAGKAALPSVIGFTVETDGRLPSGMALGEAIRAVDDACKVPPAYFIINCAHPDHFADVISGDDSWLSRIRGVRANASRMSHAELDEAEELDDGDPHELAELYLGLRTLLPQMNVVGGCCGTDHRHVEAMAKALT